MIDGFPERLSVRFGEARFRYLGESGISNLVIEDRWGEEITVRVADVLAFAEAFRSAKAAPSSAR